MIDNFLNYIYLFNNKKNVRIIDNDNTLGKTFSLDMDDLQSPLVSILTSDNSSKELINHDAIDERQNQFYELTIDGMLKTPAVVAPTPGTIVLNTIHSIDPVANGYSATPSGWVEERYSNRDPGQSPFFYHSFKMSDLSYDHESQSDPAFYRFTYKWPTIGLNKTPPIVYVDLTPWQWGSKYYSNITETSDFLYTQEVYYKITKASVWQEEKDEQLTAQEGEDGSPWLPTAVQDFFETYASLNLESEYSAARIGIPLDFTNHTYGKNKNKELGVNIKQPEYQKIYNYYDANYETLITEDDFDVRLLPSIYDFLYVDSQPGLKSFLDLPESGDDEFIKFSAMSHYLDAYTQHYAKAKAPAAALAKAESKTAIYFSEKSLDIFDQTLDKDFVFPFFTKLTIPNESMGPIAKLLSQNDLLDELNIYAASNVIAPGDPNEPNEHDHNVTVGGYYGGAVLAATPGHNAKINLLNSYDLNTFKIFLGPHQPDPQTILEAAKSTGYYIEGDPVQGEKPLSLNPNATNSQIYSTLYDIPGYDVDTHIDDLGQELNNNVLIYGDQASIKDNSSALQKFINKLKMQSFKNKFKKIISERIVSPGEIHDGKFAHEETLMYEITKYQINDDGTRQYIQSIFLPISEKTNGIPRTSSYYDTQIKPFQKYYYEIYAHKAILGSRYRTSNVNKKDGLINQDGILYALNYQIEPYIQIVRVPYYNIEPTCGESWWGGQVLISDLNYSTVVDAPPLPPDINFVPFRNVDDEILILLNNSIGEQTRHLRHILPEEKDIVEKIAISQDKIPWANPEIFFKSDDSQGSFQILRLKEPPTDYTDFAEILQEDYLELSSMGSEKNDSVIQSIKPNQDYYYIARFIDIHNKFSNPTEVFKVRMTHKQGIAPFLTVETVDIKELQKKAHEKKFLSFKGMKKYILIKPNSEQTLLFGGLPSTKGVPPDLPSEDLEPDISETDNYLSYAVELGSSKIKDSVFGKKFKIRLTSKQTGKKLDINIDVKQPEDIINE